MKVEGLDPGLLDGSPHYLSLQRFAELIGLADSPQTLAEWIHKGALPIIYFDGHPMVDLHTLRARQNEEQP